MTDDDMHNDPTDLWAIAPQEDEAEVVCPAPACGETFIVEGSYTPSYKTSRPEPELIIGAQP